MSDEIALIVLAYTPSNNKKDWQLRADGEHNWWYEPHMRSYCTLHKRIGAPCWDSNHRGAMWGTHHLNLKTNEISANPPRIYITHYPQKGEWEHIKTIDDLRKSDLYLRDEAA